jgi:lethal(2) giant larvae protein
LTNGVDSSPNKANETITSSIGDITIDSVRDHLNTTTTTLCSTTTEEIVGRLSVLSTQVNNTTTSVSPKEILDIKNVKDVKTLGETNETHQNSVIVKSVITTISHASGNAGITNGNGESEKVTTKTFRKESQF